MPFFVVVASFLFEMEFSRSSFECGFFPKLQLWRLSWAHAVVPTRTNSFSFQCPYCLPSNIYSVAASMSCAEQRYFVSCGICGSRNRRRSKNARQNTKRRFAQIAALARELILACYSNCMSGEHEPKGRGGTKCEGEEAPAGEQIARSKIQSLQSS